VQYAGERPSSSFIASVSSCIACRLPAPCEGRCCRRLVVLAYSCCARLACVDADLLRTIRMAVHVDPPHGATEET
jgi:hypothetical protein